jgi:hypothetical protein
MNNFEERLLRELRVTVAARPAARRAQRPIWRQPQLVVAGGFAATVAVAAIAGLFFFSAGTQAAYAVTRNADGTVTVEVDSITDASGLQAALEAAGVNAVVEYLPAGTTCQQPWFTPAGHIPGETQSSSVGRTSDGATRFTISGDQPPDTTLVVTTQTGLNGEQALGIAWATGNVPPCQVVDAPAGSGPLGGPPTDGNTQTDQG